MINQILYVSNRVLNKTFPVLQKWVAKAASGNKEIPSAQFLKRGDGLHL